MLYYILDYLCNSLDWTTTHLHKFSLSIILTLTNVLCKEEGTRGLLLGADWIVFCTPAKFAKIFYRNT